MGRRSHDVYTGHRAKDWLERQHINKVRKALRAARKREGQLTLDLEPEEGASSNDASS